MARGFGGVFGTGMIELTLCIGMDRIKMLSSLDHKF